MQDKPYPCRNPLDESIMTLYMACTMTGTQGLFRAVPNDHTLEDLSFFTDVGKAYHVHDHMRRYRDFGARLGWASASESQPRRPHLRDGSSTPIQRTTRRQIDTWLSRDFFFFSHFGRFSGCELVTDH